MHEIKKSEEESKTAAFNIIRIGAVTILVLVGAASCRRMQRQGASTDARQRITLPAVERDQILSEMRQMLGSVSGIVRGLAFNDLATVEESARASGMGRAVDPTLEKKLPQQFLELGLHTHESFDKLAGQVKGGSTREEIIKKLADLTGNCVTCHAIYRLDEGK